MISFYIDLPPWTDTCGGAVAMHYLAATMRIAGIPVSAHTPCWYNPTIPVKPLPDDAEVIIYPEAHLGRRLGGKKFCWYFLYYASSYHRERIPPNEAVIVWEEKYLEDVRSWTDHPIDAQDVIGFPVLDDKWCFPEKKTRDAIWFQGKGAIQKPEFIAFAVPLVNHRNTLALLRETDKFYTSDKHTIMSMEAALCGCRIFYVNESGESQEQFGLIAEAEKLVMHPARDATVAQRFHDRVETFFSGLK